MNKDQPVESIDELTILKQKAKLLGINYHPNIGLDKLKDKLDAVMKVEDNLSIPENESKASKRDRLRKSSTRLVRIRVTCMNPDKSAYHGEVFTVGNSVIGTIRKYVPFNAEEGWHVEAIILEMIQQRMFTYHYTVKDSKGQDVNRHKQAKEFSVEILPPLTEEELQELAIKQAMQNKNNNQ